MKCSQYCKWPLFIGLRRVGFHCIYSLVTPHKSEEDHGRLGLMSSFTAWGDEAVNSYDRLRNKLVVSDLLSTNTSYMFAMSNCSSCDHVCHVILFIMSYCSSCDIVTHQQFYKQVTAVCQVLHCMHALVTWCNSTQQYIIHGIVLPIMMSRIRDMWQLWVQL